MARCGAQKSFSVLFCYVFENGCQLVIHRKALVYSLIFEVRFEAKQTLNILYDIIGAIGCCRPQMPIPCAPSIQLTRFIYRSWQQDKKKTKYNTKKNQMYHTKLRNQRFRIDTQSQQRRKKNFCSFI